MRKRFVCGGVRFVVAVWFSAALLGCGGSDITRNYPSNLAQVASASGMNLDIYVPARLPKGLVPGPGGADYDQKRQGIGYVLVRPRDPGQGVLIITYRPWYPNLGITEEGRIIYGPKGLPGLELKRGTTRIFLASYDSSIREAELREIAKSLTLLKR